MARLADAGRPGRCCRTPVPLGRGGPTCAPGWRCSAPSPPPTTASSSGSPARRDDGAARRLRRRSRCHRPCSTSRCTSRRRRRWLPSAGPRRRRRNVGGGRSCSASPPASATSSPRPVATPSTSVRRPPGRPCPTCRRVAEQVKAYASAAFGRVVAARAPSPAVAGGWDQGHRAAGERRPRSPAGHRPPGHRQGRRRDRCTSGCRTTSGGRPSTPPRRRVRRHRHRRHGAVAAPRRAGRHGRAGEWWRSCRAPSVRRRHGACRRRCSSARASSGQRSSIRLAVRPADGGHAGPRARPRPGRRRPRPRRLVPRRPPRRRRRARPAASLSDALRAATPNTACPPATGSGPHRISSRTGFVIVP